MGTHSEANKEPHALSKRPHLRDIRTKNRALLLGHLLEEGAISRHDLSLRTGLTQASISRITKELIAEGICCEGNPYRAEKRLGRRRIEVCVDPNGGAVIAVCLSAFSRRIAVTDLLGKTIYEKTIPARAIKSARSTVNYIAEYVNELVNSKKLPRSKILGAAITIAGSICPKSGNIIQAPLLGWRNYPIRDHLNSSLGVSVRVENIADTLCLGHLGRNLADETNKHTIFLAHVAVGMGASLAVDGKIVGRRGDEGWIGSIPVSPFLSERYDGNRLRDVSSGQAILTRIDGVQCRYPTRETDITSRIQNAVNAANERNDIERQIFQDAGRSLGATLMQLTAAYLPDQIVLAGPIAASRHYCQAAIDAYRELAQGTDAKDTEFNNNTTEYIEAAQYLALREYVCSGIAQRIVGYPMGNVG